MKTDKLILCSIFTLASIFACLSKGDAKDPGDLPLVVAESEFWAEP